MLESPSTPSSLSRIITESFDYKSAANEKNRDSICHCGGVTGSHGFAPDATPSNGRPYCLNPILDPGLGQSRWTAVNTPGAGLLSAAVSSENIGRSYPPPLADGNFDTNRNETVSPSNW